jgi:hypothetical protein
LAARKKIEMKLITGLLLLVCVPLAVGKGPETYPTEKVAEYVAGKLSAKALPVALRPKLEKGKKALSDYGFVPTSVDEKQAIVQGPKANSRITISVLQEDQSGIYTCISGDAQNPGGAHVQRMVLLKLKNADSLLVGKISTKQFKSCPAIGGTETEAADSN